MYKSLRNGHLFHNSDEIRTYKSIFFKENICQNDDSLMLNIEEDDVKRHLAMKSKLRTRIRPKKFCPNIGLTTKFDLLSSFSI